MQTGEVIKFLRKKFNLTQDELAIKLQVNKSTSQASKNTNRARCPILKWGTIRDLCCLFSVPPWVFVFPEHIRSTERLTFIAEANVDSQVLLNEVGMQKAIEYVRDLAEIEWYKMRQDSSR